MYHSINRKIITLKNLYETYIGALVTKLLSFVPKFILKLPPLSMVHDAEGTDYYKLKLDRQMWLFGVASLGGIIKFINLVRYTFCLKIKYVRKQKSS